MAFASTKYSRSNFFDTIVDENNNIVQDITSFNFMDFYNYARNERATIHTVTSRDRGAPDLVSFLEYGGDHQYWWILMLVNKMQDPFTELATGVSMAVPSKQTIDAYYQFRRASSQSTRVTKI